ncbi:predicted protein [Botrytis cinerea T4]|uniref:Uncharacterized protein n=1 Tax=Botryotinia fuckeliana (strain T4) TaxID=999810 RepID=G2YP76_BOTF4|nr:predicted protein [Botrytis cinerea T4]
MWHLDRYQPHQLETSKYQPDGLLPTTNVLFHPAQLRYHQERLNLDFAERFPSRGWWLPFCGWSLDTYGSKKVAA